MQIQVGQQAKSSKASSQDKEKPSELVQVAEFQSTEGEQGSKVTTADKVKDIAVGVVPSLDDAIHMSIDCACECHLIVRVSVVTIHVVLCDHVSIM